MIKEPLLGQLNQGSIFTCARASRYPAVKVHGVVLTARCDLEQDKFNVLNYVPVVGLADWLEVDGFEILASRAASDLESRIESALKSIGLPKSIMLAQTPASILQHYIRTAAADKKVKASEQKFVELAERANKIEIWTKGFCLEARDIFDECESLKKQLIKELIHQRLTGYYFLPSITLGGETSGYVILLREISHLPRALALSIGSGLDATDPILVENAEWSSYVDYCADDFAMPIAEITSPNVEHLLQTFSHLFGRIGLPDPDRAMIEALTDTRPLEREVQ